jgi:hypothetical protein
MSSMEISWFGALCDDDYEQLGVVQPALRSSWEHCSSIVRATEDAGFDNILLPSGYDLGIDTVSFASSIAPLTSRMKLLVAVRCGEVWVPQLARQLATLNQTLNGRLNINIISSEMPGESLNGPARYRRTTETMKALRTLMNGERLDVDGEFLQLHLDAPRICTETAPCPPFYFGGLSDEARETAAQDADVYLNARPTPLLPTSFLQWTARPEMPFVHDLSTAQVSAFVAKQNFAKQQVQTALLKTTCGQELEKPDRVVAQPLWEHQRKWRKKFAGTTQWELRPSSCLAIPISTRLRDLRPLFCHCSSTDQSPFRSRVLPCPTSHHFPLNFCFTCLPHWRHHLWCPVAQTAPASLFPLLVEQ